jgi:hypothetical protein
MYIRTSLTSLRRQKSNPAIPLSYFVVQPVRTQGPAGVREQLVFTRLNHVQALAAFSQGRRIAILSDSSIHFVRLNHRVLQHIWLD